MPSPTESAAPSITGSATTPTSTTTVGPSPAGDLITRGPDIDFPDDMAMIIESGCWGCDGGPGPLTRIYRDSRGAIRQDSLTDALQGSLPLHTYDTPNGPQTYPSPMNGLAMTPDASVMAVSFCLIGTCAFSGLVGFEADSEGVAYRSLDGGISWQEVGRGGPVFAVNAVLSDGRVLVTHTLTDDGNNPQYFLLPDDTPVTAPQNGGYPPVALSNRIFWPTGDGQLLTSDGRPFVPARVNRYFRSFLGTVSDDLQKGSALTYWRIEGPTPRPSGYIDRFGIELLNVGDGAAMTQRIWEIEGYIAKIGHWNEKDGRLIVSINTETPDRALPLPAIVDLDDGTYSLIPSPFEDERLGQSSFGRTYVDAVQIGPFAQVAGINSCLNVRAEPSLSGPVLACMADGVLLRDMEETADADGQTWARVMTPGGLQGWASAGYLER